LLCDLEGWSHREIADALGITETNSRQHVFVARRKLRERLGEKT
jgi:DNA-directed RNA polymerase specialized sigma24 family protein